MANTLPLGMNSAMDKKYSAAVAKRKKQNNGLPNNDYTTNNPVDPAVKAENVVRIKTDPKTGVKNGIDLPTGESYNGISPEDVQKILDNYNNDRAAPAATMTQQEQIAADYAKQQATKAYADSQRPENVTAEQLAFLADTNKGTTSDVAAFQNSPITASIEENLRKRPSAIGAKIISGTIIKAIDSETKGVGSSTLGSIVSKNPNLKNYLTEYSNGDNAALIQQDVANGQTSLKLAIKMANQPGDSQEAIVLYKEGVQRVRVADMQLKMLADKSPQDYTEKLKVERANIKFFLDEVEPELRKQMANSLQRPDPAYIDSALNQALTGK